jgi:hypothetical protein
MAYVVPDFYGVVAESVTQQTDTITLSHTTPAALSRTGIVSYPATATEGAAPTANVIVVKDTTSGHTLVLGTDYTLTASGAGETLTYSVTRINTSSNSSDGDTAKVTYLFGTMFYSDAGQGVAGTAPTGTAFEASTTDTEGASAGGMGSAGGYGSKTDPAMGSQSSSETGAPGSEYKATEVAPNSFGWPGGVPDTEGVYGGGLPESFTPSSTNLSGTLETTGTGTSDMGSNLQPSEYTSPNPYRSPTTGVAGSSKDTTLTDILGNQANAPQVPSQTSYAATNVDTSYSGAPAQPSALSTQTDAVTAAQAATNYYLSQQGVLPASIVVTNTTQSLTMVLGTDYTVTTSGNGATTVSYITPIVAAHFAAGNNISIAYSYGNPQYWDSNMPASVPGAPGTPSVTAVNRGVKLQFTVPGGQTPVDYYMVQSYPDLGTQYVPALGQPMLDGQPAGSSGGATVGQPTYQADTLVLLAAALSAPAAPTVTPTGSGGTVTAGVYKAAVTYVNANGETVASSTTTAASLTSGQDLVITSPAAVTGATGWYAYVSQAGGSTLTRQQAVGSPTAIGTNLTLTTTPTSSGANPPAANTSAPTLSKTGIITPPQQVVVRDNTRVGADPLQADGQVLEYGYDYTITQTGIGPWTTYTVVFVASSVNAKAGDSITVEYQYGADPGTITTVFTQGLTENTPVIYRPDGTTPYNQGYAFRVAAGNRAGLGAYSALSSYAVPLNYNAPQPGHEGSTETITSLDPANTVNPIYLPNGTIKSGTGLGG